MNARARRGLSFVWSSRAAAESRAGGMKAVQLIMARADSSPESDTTAGGCAQLLRAANADDPVWLGCQTVG